MKYLGEIWPLPTRRKDGVQLAGTFQASTPRLETKRLTWENPQPSVFILADFALRV